MAALRAHPELRQRVSSIVLAVEGDEGALKEADAAEERMVEETRLLGREALRSWAERRVEATEREIRQRPQMHRLARTNHYAAPPDCTTLDRTRGRAPRLLGVARQGPLTFPVATCAHAICNSSLISIRDVQSLARNVRPVDSGRTRGRPCGRAPNVGVAPLAVRRRRTPGSRCRESLSANPTPLRAVVSIRF